MESALVMVLALAIAVAVVVGMIIRAKERVQNEVARADLQRQLIAKVDSPEAIARFLEGGGANFLFSLDKVAEVAAIQRVVQSTRGAVMLAVTGFTFIFVEVFTDNRPVAALGVLAVGLAGGRAASAYVSLALSRRWGLFKGGERAAQSWPNG